MVVTTRGRGVLPSDGSRRHASSHPVTDEDREEERVHPLVSAHEHIRALGEPEVSRGDVFGSSA